MWNAKVKCIKSRTLGSTQNKIYDIINGRLIWDNGSESSKFKNIDDLNYLCSSVFEIYNPTLKDLLTVGRVVELRDGTMGFVLPDRIITKDGWYDINDYDVNCKDKNYPNLNIVEIYDCPISSSRAWNFGAENKKSLISVWKREEKSQAQIEKDAIRSEMEKLAKRLEELEVK